MLREDMASIPSYEPCTVRFGVFEVDLRAGELRRNGFKVKLQNQPFQILGMLLERPGEVITRDEMRARLWPAETFLDVDHGLNSAIRRVRDALGDSAESPTFIETLGRRGYRFVFPVEHLCRESGNSGLAVVGPISKPEPSPVMPQEPPQAKSRWKLKTGLGIAAGPVVLGAMLAFIQKGHLSVTKLDQPTRRVVVGSGDSTLHAVTQRQLTANPQDTPVTSAALSPNGTYLAYTDKTGFYVRQVSNGETHPVAVPKGFAPLVQSWFPDGGHLVVSWVAESGKQPGLWSTSIFGGTPIRIAEEGSSGRVSRDGSKIAFLRAGQGRNEIWLMAADGTKGRRLVGSATSEREFFSPVAWAPDGRRVAYTRTIVPVFNAADVTGVKRSIEIVDVESGHFESVMSTPEIEDALGWTPDNFLIYSLRESTPEQGDFGLWRMPLNPMTARPMGSGVRFASGRGWAQGLEVAGDGKSMALRRTEPADDVYVAGVEAGAKRLLPRRLTLDDRGDFVFSWTPDSKSVLFLSNREGPIHLYRQAIEQIQAELLVGGNDSLAIPRMNSTGTDILYLVMPKHGESPNMVKIMRVPLAGGMPQLVLEAHGIWNHQCARVPATLCLYSPGEPNQQRFFAFDPMTGASHEVAAARVNAGSGRPNWSLSPDGNYLATQILSPTQDAAIRILSLNDGSKTILPLQGWPVFSSLDWAADGKSLWVGALNARSGGAETCRMINVERTGKIRVMTDKGDVCFLAGIPSPDGRHLALEGVKGGDSNVWLLENF